VRRLRAKLGPEHESMIGTVRHVGYKFVAPPVAALSDDSEVLPGPAVRSAADAVPAQQRIRV
jgi:DNA-binding winged helix-turn-helix (wHTH) protein